MLWNRLTRIAGRTGFAAFFLLASFGQPIQAQTPSLAWAGKAGGLADSEIGRDVAVDGAGNVLIVGDFNSTADLDFSAGVFNLTSAGNADGFVTKMDSSGQFVWARQLGGPDGVTPLAVTTDGIGNVYVAGNFRGTADFDPGPTSFLLTSAGRNDAFVVKLDSAGNLVWALRFGGPGFDSARAIGLDGAGNVHTTGVFRATADFDPGPRVVSLTSLSAWGSVAFISKLDADGDFLWARALQAANFSSGTGVAIDGAGHVVSTGSFTGTTDFDPGVGTMSLTPVGSNDAYVWKLDADGALVWARSFGGSSFDIGEGLAVDASDNVYTCGHFRLTTDFDPGVGTVNLTSAGNADIFVSKLDSNGDYVWARRMGGVNSDRAFALALALDASGGVHTTGTMNGTSDLDPGPGVFNLTSAGANDIFISKLDANGTFQWAGRAGSPDPEEGHGIAVDGSGGVYATGRFHGTVDFDPCIGVSNVTTAGEEDAFLLKITAPGYTLVASTSGGGVGDLTLDVANIPPAASHAWILASSTAAPGGVGTGSALGLVPDALLSHFLSIPSHPACPFHFPVANNVYATSPVLVAPGTLSALSGQTWEATAVAYDAATAQLVGQSCIASIPW